MAIKISIKRRVKYHLDHAARRIRFHSLRPFSKHGVEPPVKGRIICHIRDFGASGGLLEQLRYLIDRDVATFRIYTDRRPYVEAILEGGGLKPGCSTSIIDLSSSRLAENSVWKHVDAYNWAHSHEKWSLILNTGEYLLYPHFDTRTIPDLCQFLSDEHRRSLFSIILDAYAIRPDTSPLAYGIAGWHIDRYGYDFRYTGAHDTDIWYGGFTYRFRDKFTYLARKHITRIALQKIGRKSMPSRDLVFALPPKVSTASSANHLSPTGCILSSRCFEHWKVRSIIMGQDPDFEKLATAPAIPITWRPSELVECGFMNEGQWL